MSPGAGPPAASSTSASSDVWPEPPRDPLLDRPPILDRVPVVRDLDTPRLIHRLHRVIWLLAILAALGWFVLGANRPPDPSLRPLFGTMSINIASPAGNLLPSPLCVQTADVQVARFRGLTERDSLDGYAGMLFVYAQDSAGQFVMKNPAGTVRFPLSIAWFAADGTFVSAKDMPVCGDAVCPTFSADAPYRYALEVPQGQLGALGVGPASKLRLGDEGCTPPAAAPPAPAAPPAAPAG